MNTSGSMIERSIVVSWAMSEPGLEPKSWHKFEPNPKTPVGSQLEKDLLWPAGTISILEKAFEQKLSRSIGWQLDKVSGKDPYFVAAKVFRRGVAQSSLLARQVAGTYKVSFKASKKPSDLLQGEDPIIIDSNVAKAWKIDLRAQDLSIALNESTKSLESVAAIKDWILKNPGTINIVGGGILADTAAFAAALCDRPFRLYPTTLLAMLDACVGGKTGVNFGRFGKNQIGLFAFPAEVVISSTWLKTLSERDFKAGLAEGYKHAVIAGNQSLAEQVSQLPLRIEAIDPLLVDLVRVKAEIIAQDPNEAGIRAVLNFGHTLAHAIEKVSHEYSPSDPILHGEAIGVGMLFAIRLSNKLGHLNDKSYEEVSKQLSNASFLIPKDQFQKQLGLTNLPEKSLIKLLSEGVLQDKKNQEKGSSEWVLPEDWGKFATRGKTYTVPVSLEVFERECRIFLLESGFLRQDQHGKL